MAFVHKEFVSAATTTTEKACNSATSTTTASIAIGCSVIINRAFSLACHCLTFIVTGTRVAIAVAVTPRVELVALIATHLSNLKDFKH